VRRLNCGRLWFLFNSWIVRPETKQAERYHDGRRYHGYSVDVQPPRMTAQSRSWKSPDRKGARSPAVVSGRTTKQPILHLSAASRPRDMREPAKRDCRHKCLYKKLEKKHEAMMYALIVAAESFSYGEKWQGEQAAAASAPGR
jgi:hypothetical protein